MSKKRNTKKALLFSALCMMLCVSMMVGSTFAWFTDTDTVATSNIVSGTLDIEIVDESGNKLDDGLTFVNVDNSSNIKWEPGATFRTQGFFVKNVGNLWLKYKMEINNDTVSYNKLNEVIEWTIVHDDGTVVDLSEMVDITLGPDKTHPAELMYIQGKMKTEAGNEYQGLTLTDVGITIYAAQAPVEYDSIDNKYDETAKYGNEKEDDTGLKVTDDTSLTEAIESKEPYVVIGGDYKKTVISDGVEVVINGGTYHNQVIAARNGGMVIVNDAQAGSVESGGGPNVLANVNQGSKVIINGGSYLTNVVLYGDGTGTVEITGGNFDCGSLYFPFGNLPVASLTITGGTFRFMMGSPISDYVPDTHKIVNNANGFYTVVAK